MGIVSLRANPQLGQVIVDSVITASIEEACPTGTVVRQISAGRLRIGWREALPGGLFADAERRADLSPAATRSPRLGDQLALKLVEGRRETSRVAEAVERRAFPIACRTEADISPASDNPELPTSLHGIPPASGNPDAR